MHSKFFSHLLTVNYKMNAECIKADLVNQPLEDESLSVHSGK